MTLIIAVGAHRKNTPEEFVELCGPEVCHRVRVVNHDAWDATHAVFLGRTSRGTPVEASRLALEADKLILTGGVNYHYMVGYGGGRKSVMPGICSNKTIQACHLWSLEPEAGAGRSQLTQSRITNGNPAHEDMMECASLVKPYFIVNGVSNLDGDICDILAGNWMSAWLRATQLVDAMHGAEIQEKAEFLKKQIRKSDILARLGGDEFVALMDKTTDDLPQIIAKRLRESILNFNIAGTRSYKLFLSIGFAHYDPTSPCSLQELLNHADEDMYKQKKMKKENIK